MQSPFLPLAIRAARAGNVVLRRRFPMTNRTSMKDVHNVVTKSDAAAEKAILKVIIKGAPNHSYFSEETGYHKGSSSWTWVIDPLDGTTNFSHHFPYFGVSIALIKGDKIELGVVANTQLREMYWASATSPAFCNNRQIHIHHCAPARAVISISRGASPVGKKRILKAMGPLSKIIRTFRFHGASAVELCDVAAGRVDGFFGISMQAYDIAAGALIASRAGASLLTKNGKPWIFQNEPTDLVAAHSKLAVSLSKIL